VTADPSISHPGVIALALTLALGLGLPAAGAAAARRPRDAGPLALTIRSIGRTGVGRETLATEPHASVTNYYVHERERLTVGVSAPLPGRARLYPLVRREGDSAWRVQPPAVAPVGRSPADEWTAEIELGAPGDTGARLEVQVIAAAEPLPVLLSDRMKERSALAESEVLRVERLLPRPSVAIAGMLDVAPAAKAGAAAGAGAGGDPQYVFGDTELVVHDQALVQVTAENVPAGARVGVVVRFAGDGRRMLMADFGTGSGPIVAFFLVSRRSGEATRHFEIMAFAVWDDDSSLPPQHPVVRPGRLIPPAEWQQLRPRFLAESRVVRVRWEECRLAGAAASGGTAGAGGDRHP
jgi:hypothetical protein